MTYDIACAIFTLMEKMDFDIVIVGAGPSGLSTAIRLIQLNSSLKICILEKGSQVGSHILSGAVLEPKALTTLLPNWKEDGAPIRTKVTKDTFLLLTQRSSITLPTPPQMRNENNYIISLGELCQWLANQAENFGVQIFPGFAATELLYDENKRVIGVKTGDMGLNKESKPTEQFQAGVHIYAKQTILAEGCHGSLTKQILKNNQQSYGLGIKEVWQIPDQPERLGNVIHSVGWPLDHQTYGGSFLYYLDVNKIAVGFVVGLDYKNPYLDPFQEFQRFKTHPDIQHHFQEGKRIEYGARALVEGGWQSIPKLTFPGGLLVGDTAGFLNVPKIKGIHNAIESGIIAAETIIKNYDSAAIQELSDYNTAIKNSSIGQELHKVRNIRPGFKWGLFPGLLNAAFETYISKGKSPWTLKHNIDHLSLKTAKNCSTIVYPKPDGVISFDKLSSVYLSNISSQENQPNHLILKNPEFAIDINLKKYASPESHYCPANVYEIIEVNGKKQLQINSANCIHCKTCDIKDPLQNINWVPPQGGSGPNYSGF